MDVNTQKTRDTLKAVPPNPGSPEAVDAGCLCHVGVNHSGRGVTTHNGEALFLMEETCPLHGEKQEVTP